MTIKELIEELEQFGNDECEILLWGGNGAKIIGVNTFPDEEDPDGPVYIITDHNDIINEMMTELLLLSTNKELGIYLSILNSEMPEHILKKYAGEEAIERMKEIIKNRINGGK